MSYQEYGAIPVTPINLLEQTSRAPYIEHFPPPRRAPPMAHEPFSMVAPDANAAPSPASAVDVNLQELRQIKYILIGIAILLLLSMILRR